MYTFEIEKKTKGNFNDRMKAYASAAQEQAEKKNEESKEGSDGR